MNRIYITTAMLIFATACSQKVSGNYVLKSESVGCEKQVSDIEGNQYRVVKIGSQCWMAENLRATKYNDGSRIPKVYQLDKEDKDASRWGRLYEWTSLHQTSGICPRGWRVPSDKDFNRLEAALGMSPETIAKTGWRHTNDEGLKIKKYDYAFSYSGEKKKKINQSGFAAIPSGVRRVVWGIPIEQLGTYGDLWASTEFDKEKAWTRTFVWMAVHWASNQIRRKAVEKDWAFAVRCLKE